MCSCVHVSAACLHGSSLALIDQNMCVGKNKRNTPENNKNKENNRNKINKRDTLIHTMSEEENARRHETNVLQLLEITRYDDKEKDTRKHTSKYIYIYM